jgi:hypothetical protein
MPRRVRDLEVSRLFQRTRAGLKSFVATPRIAMFVIAAFHRETSATVGQTMSDAAVIDE